MKQRIRILVVEDEPDQRQLVSGLLRRAGYEIDAAASVSEAKTLLEKGDVDIVFSDWKLEGEDGLQLLEHVQLDYPETGFILATGHGSIAHAVQSVRAGADDYLVKPYQKDALLFALERVCRARLLIRENKALEQALTEREYLVDLIGHSACMQTLFNKIERLASTRATILISGESGTGKELAARALHQLSNRKDQPFVAVNCAAIPESLAEAEFFGTEKGAFTGSTKLNIGKFEFAQGGTLFLDEVGEMPLLLQVKLLRLLQEGVLTRIGGNKEIKVDIRLVAATNRDLQEEVNAGRFREDLFYRLNVVPIEMPPLRDRKEDIPALTKHFSQVACRRHEVENVRFTPTVLKSLTQYSWPGNVRELGNVIERMVLMSENGEASETEIPQIQGSDTAPQFELPLAGFNWDVHERDCLQQAMNMCHGNRTQAAKKLDLAYKAFLYRLEKHQLI